MYSSSYIPQFPYLGDQVAIGSGRLIFHAKDDTAFIFADKAISLATSGSTHINSSQGIFMNGKTIELGLNAQEPVIKGQTAVDELTLLYTNLQRFASAVGGLSETELELAIVDIAAAATVLSKTLIDLRERLPDMLSKTTKTL